MDIKLTPEQIARAVDKTAEAADAGNAEMCALLFLKYEHGFDVPKNLTLAYKWLERAAELGDAWSIHNLGLVYEEGRLNNPIDKRKAFELFELAFSKNFPHAAEKLAEYYENGIVFEKDLKAAFEFWKIDADCGGRWAQLHLSRMLMLGRGCEIDLNLANEYLQTALKQFAEWDDVLKIVKNNANSGYKPAMEFLGLAHLHGWFGCPIDPALSKQWLEKADSPTNVQGN